MTGASVATCSRSLGIDPRKFLADAQKAAGHLQGPLRGVRLRCQASKIKRCR